MRIIFCGTPDFAASHLQGLLENQINPIAVFTQPDRPTGRGQKLIPCLTKHIALENQIPVFQFTNLKSDEVEKIIRQLKPDLIIVVAYGLIIPKTILSIPFYGCINVHASLLPRWRGAAPIQRAIEAGDKKTGITIMQMDEGLDTGDMLLIKPCTIEPDETGETLQKKLAKLGIDGLIEVINQLNNKTVKAIPQPKEDLIYAHKISKEETTINWQYSAEKIERQIRAWQPHLIAKTYYQGQIIKIWKAAVLDKVTTHSRPGLIRVEQNKLIIQCGQGELLIEKIQKAGGKPLETKHFIQNNTMISGQKLGE